MIYQNVQNVMLDMERYMKEGDVSHVKSKADIIKSSRP